MESKMQNANGTEQWEELMEPWAYAAAAIVLFLIGFFGFFLNLFVILLMCKDKQLWTPLNIILFNLVCSDLSVSILGNPWTMTSAMAHRWLYGPTMCVAYGFFMALLGITSITTLTVLSFERYLLVSHPLSSRQQNRRGALFAVGFIWLYSLCLTLPPLFGWGAYVNEAANISCSVNWETQTWNTTSYILYIFAFGSFLPIIIISYSYINIVRTMKQNSLRMGRVSRAEGRVTWMVAAMIAAFFIAWAPYSILALIEQFAPPDIISPAMAVLPALMAKSSICYNPLIYVGMNTQFHAAWKRLFASEARNETSMMQQATVMSPTHVPSLDYLDETKRNFARTLMSTRNNNTSNDTNYAGKPCELSSLAEGAALAVKRSNENNRQNTQEKPEIENVKDNEKDVNEDDIAEAEKQPLKRSNSYVEKRDVDGSLQRLNLRSKERRASMIVQSKNGVVQISNQFDSDGVVL